MSEASLVIRLKPGRSMDPAPAGGPEDGEVALLRKVFAAAGVRPERLFSPPVLALSAEMQARHPGRAPDLSRYYRVVLATKELGPAPFGPLLAALAPAVGGAMDGCYVSPAPTPPAGNPFVPGRTPHLEPHQGYLDPPEAGGVGARRAWRMPGGNGAGVRISDVEEAWHPSHEDLPPVKLLGGPPHGGWAARDWGHGTAVLGVLGAMCNGYGMTGIAHGAELSFASVFDSSDGVANESDAIGRAAVHLDPGDVLLIEQHKPHRTLAQGEGSPVYLPVEWWPANFDVILTAALKGVLVVEPAGNSGFSLDDPRLDDPDGFPTGWRNPFSLGGPDSGAILVGAGNPPTQGIPGGGGDPPARSRYAISNHGRRVDVQGWGIAVATCGRPADLSPAPDDRTYTSTFSGTSAASAIVAGVLACAQGMRRALWPAGPFLDPTSARDLLRRTGQPQTCDGATRAVVEPIGNLPDLAELFP